MPPPAPFRQAASAQAADPRSGFTLIELMIAVTLSTVIVYTAMAAFRVVGQAVTTCQRMSLENGLMRSGFFAALDELDFWDLYDDRNATTPASNPLRSTAKPFCPLTWDPTRKEADPRTWWRGFGFAQDQAMSAKWGNYAALSRAGHSDPVRAWYPAQIKSFKDTLGDYGMIAYSRGDAVFGWYEGTASAPTYRGKPQDVWERTATTPVTANSAAYDQGARGDLLPRRPAHWPGLTVETRRYVVWSSFIDLCQVEVTSPLSGEATRLSFWGVGTSLRGARQQRNLDTVQVR